MKKARAPKKGKCDDNLVLLSTNSQNLVLISRPPFRPSPPSQFPSQSPSSDNQVKVAGEKNIWYDALDSENRTGQNTYLLSTHLGL